MDLNSPDTWRWIWFIVAVIGVVGELSLPATFFCLPFAVGAVVAGLSAMLGLGVGLEVVVFMVVSLAAFAGFWPLGRRLENRSGAQEGVGATRWVGQEARVVEDIREHGYGTVRLEREVWRAESLTGSSIRKGSTVVVTRLAGTRLVVVPVDEPLDDFPSTSYLDSGGDDSTQGAN